VGICVAVPFPTSVLQLVENDFRGGKKERVLRERVTLREEGGDHKRTGLSFSFRIYVKTRVRNTTRRTNPQSGRDRD